MKEGHDQNHIESLPSDLISAEVFRLSKVGKDLISTSGFNNAKLSHILETSNSGCKELIRRGGIIPPVLYEDMRLGEMVGKNLGDEHFYTSFTVIAADQINPVQISKSAKIQGYFAMRSLLTRRKIGGILEDGEYKWDETIITINDVLHLIFPSKDMGWIFSEKIDHSTEARRTNKKNEAMEEELKKIEDMVDQNHRLNEVIRRILMGEKGIVKNELWARKQLSTLDGFSPHGLSVIGGETGIKLTSFPSFSAEDFNISFGQGDIRNTNDLELSTLKREIDQKIELWISKHRSTLRQVMQGNYKLGRGKIIAGQRENTNPALLYHSRIQ